MKKGMNRRDFLIKGPAAAVGAGLALKSGLRGKPSPSAESRIVEVFHSGCVDDNRNVDQKSVQKMLSSGMERLTGTSSPWKKFFHPDDRVGLKINTLGRPNLFTHHELIAAVTGQLREIGIRENNIIVWDRFETHMRDSRFSFNTSAEGVCCYGTEPIGEEAGRFDPEYIYTSELDNPARRESDGTRSLFSKIFTRECDKVINMAILKDHGLSAVTLCLKNLAYGLCNNNGRFHGREHIGPFIADFCAIPIVRKKVVLHMIDGIEACFEQGPVPRNPRFIYPQRTLWLGTDPVALDAVGYEVIQKKRKTEGVPPLEETGRSTEHIRLAAEKGIGTDNLERIRIDKINLG